MNDASNVPTAGVLDAQAEPDSELGSSSRLALYVAVGLAAGSVIALQIDVMRVFSVGSWAHFGSLVVSLAMLGFGLASAVMTVAKDWFARNWRVAATASLALFGPHIGHELTLFGHQLFAAIATVGVGPAGGG